MSVNISIIRSKLELSKDCGVSKYGHNHAETVVADSFSIVAIEIEHTSISRVIVIATAIEERVTRIREVRVVV